MDSYVDTERLALARRGDERALAEILSASQPRLLRMVELRIEPSLRRRLDPADVVQDALLEAVRRFAEWTAQDTYPFHVWLRLITAQELAHAHRHHLSAHKRDALREQPFLASRPSVSAAGAADFFIASNTSPTQAARREELRASVHEALDELEELDREILALRHFEGLSNEDAALELAIEPAAASKRFVRALLRLRTALKTFAPDDWSAAP